MTIPGAPIPPAPAAPELPPPPQPPPSPPEPVQFPLSWMLAHASAPLQYRSITDVARLDIGSAAANLALSYRPALTLAVLQSADGAWGDSILGLPGARAEHFEGIGTIPAFRRLLEYGWDRETPPLIHARRILFRLLAEDDDPAFLFEFAGKNRSAELVHRARAIIREAAASALAQAGYEGDPRLRGAAKRILDRVDTYLHSPLAQKPWVRVANKQVLSPDASPPSIYMLTMIAFMPLFRSERHTQVERLYAHLAQPLPRQESQQLVGGQIVSQPHLVLGDPLPTRNAVDADLPFALTWLELMARMQCLRRNDGWLGAFERLLEDRDRDYVWHPHRGLVVPRASEPAVWPSFPLDPQSGGERSSDVTFRLGLIARLLGRPIELV